MDESPTQLQSSKISPSDPLALERQTLVRMNRIPAGASDDQVRSVWAAWQAAQIAPKPVGNMTASILAASKPNEDLDRAKWREHQRREDAERQEMLRRNRGEFLFKDSGCPERHVIGLDSLDAENPKWISLRDDLVTKSQFANGFIVALLGPRGPGKTQLAVSVIHQLCQKCISCRYVKALNLFQDIRRAFTPKSAESEDSIMDGWVRPSFLAIDEMTHRGGTEWEKNSLVNILDQRYDARKCTILIANQSKAEFATAMGDSIVSRIHETGEAIICDWPSYRKPNPGGWRQSGDAEKRKV